MNCQHILDADLLFAAADGVWRSEIARVYGPENVTACCHRPEACGEPGSLLRQAHEAREHAYRAWRGVHGLDEVERAPLALQSRA